MLRRAVSFARVPQVAYPLGALVLAGSLLVSLKLAVGLSQPPWLGVAVAAGLLVFLFLLVGVSLHYRLAVALYFLSLPTQNVTLLPYFSPIKLSFVVLVYALVRECLRGKRSFQWVARLHVPQIAFVGISILTTVLHYQPDPFAAREMLRFGSAMALLALLPSFFMTTRDVRVACWAGAAILGVMEIYAGVQVLRGMGRIPATFAHGADFAVFLVFTVPLCWYLMTLRETGAPLRLILAGISFVGFLCILLTGTRSGYLGALVMVIVTIGLFRSLRIPVIAMAIVSILIFVALWPRLTDLRGEIDRKFRFESGKGQMGVEISTSTRVMTLDVAKRIVRKNPLLGVGIGSFRREMISYIPKEYQGYFVHTVAMQKGGRVAHNTFAAVWAETGTLGFVAFLTLTGLAIWNLVRLMRGSPVEISVPARFLLVAYIGTFLTGFLHGGFLVSQYCWLHLGIGYGLANTWGKAASTRALNKT